MGDTMKKIIHAVRSCRVFRQMTLEEAKDICLTLTEPMIRENELALKAALDHDDYSAAARHWGRMAVRAGKTCLKPASMLLHFRLLVGRSREREDIIVGCFDANFELMLRPRSGSGTEPSRPKEPSVH
jgi:hypothetical protein